MDYELKIKQVEVEDNYFDCEVIAHFEEVGHPVRMSGDTIIEDSSIECVGITVTSVMLGEVKLTTSSELLNDLVYEGYKDYCLKKFLETV